MSLTLHGPGYGLDERESLFALLRGLVAAIANGSAPPKLQTVTIIERNERRIERLIQYLKDFVYESSHAKVGLIEGTTLQVLHGKGGTFEKQAPTVHRGKENKIVFVAMPFSEEFTDTYYYGIQPAAHSNSLLCERVDAVSFTGDVVERIKVGIEKSTLVIADLTTTNPSVYLEVGYAWACRKPIILIARDPGELKFDVRSQRCIIYKTVRELEEALLVEIRSVANS